MEDQTQWPGLVFDRFRKKDSCSFATSCQEERDLGFRLSRERQAVVSVVRRQHYAVWLRELARAGTCGCRGVRTESAAENKPPACP